jgi:hypothetical protein
MWVAKQVDEVLAKRQEIGRPSKQKWRGSLLGGCMRAHWYSSQGVPHSEPFTADTLRVFAMGNAVGDFLVNALTEKYGNTIRFEVPIESPKQNFSGNIDGLLAIGASKLAVLEFKSIKSAGFKRLDGPKPEHATQAASYAQTILDQADAWDCNYVEAWVVYVCKDSFEIAEYPVNVNEWGERSRRILRVLNYYGDRKPPRLPKASTRKWPCGWCNWRTECLGGAK